MKEMPTFFERAGDLQMFEKLFKKFYAKVLRDDLFGVVFKDMSPEQVQHVSHFVADKGD